MSIVLDDGFVVFLLDLGSGVGITRSVERVEMNTWHNVTVLRSGGEVVLHVDTQTVTVSVSGPGQLSLGQQLWVGGVSDLMSLPATLSSNILTGYQGCLASLEFNGEAADPINNALIPSDFVNQGCEGKIPPPPHQNIY